MKWKKVFEGISEPEAELLVQFLKSESISAVLINKRSSPYQIGKVEIHTPDDQHHTATGLVENYFNNSNVLI